MFTRELKKTSLTLDKNYYDLFKNVCKVNNTDASKEIRKFVESYVKNNHEIVDKLKKA